MAVIQRTRTQSVFDVCGSAICNSLPPDIRTIVSRRSFRRALKSHSFREALYTTQAKRWF